MKLNNKMYKTKKTLLTTTVNTGNPEPVKVKRKMCTFYL